MGKSYSWALIVRGAVAIVFGAMAIFWPGLTVDLLVMFFGAFALVGGTFGVIAAVQAKRHHRQWGLMLLDGVIGVSIGLLTFFRPEAMVLAWILLIAFWALFGGMLQVASACTAPWPARSRWMLGIAGALSIVLGAFIFFFPPLGALYIAWLIGFYALFFGLMLLSLGWDLRKMTSLTV